MPAVLLAGTAGFAAAAPPDSLEGLPIAAVQVVPRNIYDPVPQGRLAPLYRLANRLHIRTRETTIREQLLFAPGGRWSQRRGDETERNLRALDFLTPLPIQAERSGDSVLVTVTTRDIWSTSPEFNFQSFEGKSYGSIAFTEENLLGYGKGVSFNYREEPTGLSRSIAYDDPAFRGSRVQLHYLSSNGSLGSTDRIAIGQPFYAEETRRTWEINAGHSTSPRSLFQRAAVAATIPEARKHVEVAWGTGVRHDGVIQRVVWSFLANERRLGRSLLEPGTPAAFDGPEEVLRTRRLAGEVQLWHPHYIERTNVDRMHLIEDFEVGQSVGLKVGVSPRTLGSTADEGYGKFRLALGTAGSLGFGWVRAEVESRLRAQPVETIERLDARWVAQTIGHQTLVLAAQGVRGSRTTRDFQVVTGGLNGLRAYPIQAVAGKRLWRLNAENRWVIGEDYWRILTIGAVAFADAARAWGVGATGSEWFLSSGFGFRLAAPQWSLGQILRIDVAWPVTPTRDGRRRPVLSVGSSQAF